MRDSIPARLAVTALACLGLASLPATARQPDGGGALAPQDAADHVSEALDRRLAGEAAANIARLRAEGRLPAAQAGVIPKVSGLQWPLSRGQTPGTDWHGISNFVDLNPTIGQLRDYTCGTRTYDTAGGYNHRGVDYFIWPFSWMLLDQGAVEVRAVAPGTLVGRADGNNDRSCSMNAPDTPNYVTVRHADGTIARYLHMKNGSVTTRPIGSAIAVGEVLGRVGSSGVSTGPHLHLELRANENANAAVIEPHNGACNTTPSAWAEQRPYRQPAINRLSTHNAPPVQPSCSGTTMPGTDVPNFRDQFNPGEKVIFLAAYRDQAYGELSEFRVLRPDNSVFTSWNLDTAAVPGAQPVYNASYWYWEYTLPGNAPHGLWQWEARYQGVTTRHYFRVGNSTQAIPDMKGLIGAWFEPATSGQGFELHWLNDEQVLLFFYGHHDDGSNFFLLAQRWGRFDFNQEVEFELYQTTGGRWTDLDPAQIQRPGWGTARITFVDCETAVAELDGIDGSQVLNLERLGRTVGLSCD